MRRDLSNLFCTKEETILVLAKSIDLDITIETNETVEKLSTIKKIILKDKESKITLKLLASNNFIKLFDSKEDCTKETKHD